MEQGAHPLARGHRTPRPRRVAGFTLIELMVTIVVVAIFASLAAPSFRQMIATQRVRSAASAITESLWLARSEAIKRNTDVSFSFSNVADGWQVMAGGTAIHAQDALPAVSSTDAAYTFNPYGRVTGFGKLHIGVSSAGVYRCVTVSSSGRSSVEDGKCS